MKPRKSLVERLSAQKALLGLQQTHPNPVLAELAGMCGYDFLMLDSEHGLFSEEDYLRAIQAVAATGLLVLVRLAGHSTHAVGRYMDVGVDAILVPNVSTAEQAKALVRAMEYPPRGTRGFGAALHRGTRYGMDLAEHLKAPRANVSLLVLIESTVGVSNAESILDVEGVDGVVVGPSDLTADLGNLRDFSQPAYREALGRIEQAALARGKLLGTAPHAGNPLESLIARGHRLFILDADISLIREAMSSQVSKARATLEKP
jgi:4-hydroxy-2-oxoheptanedioate aldolase